MEKDYVCPILSPHDPEIPYTPCLKEECAWWSEKHQKCAVAVELPKK